MRIRTSRRLWRNWPARTRPSPRLPRTEDELFDLHQLRHFAQDLGLARRSGRTLTLTAKGRRLLADPDGLWRAVAARLLGDDEFAGDEIY
jgi:hypothetical protein